MHHTNIQKKISDAMLIVIICGVSLIIVFITNIFGNDYSELLFLFPGLLSTILGLIFYFVFKNQAVQFDKIINSNNYLAKWKVDSFVWNNFIEKDYKFNMKKSYQMAKVSLIIIVPVIIFCTCMMDDNFDRLLFSAIMAGCFIVTSALIYYFNNQKYQQRKKLSSAEIIVTEKSLIINSEFYNWGAWGSRFEHIKHLEEENMLQFVYSVSSRSGRINQEINVPINKYENEQLSKIKEFFKNKS
jgi:hypothetical protein